MSKDKTCKINDEIDIKKKAKKYFHWKISMRTIVGINMVISK